MRFIIAVLFVATLGTKLNANPIPTPKLTENVLQSMALRDYPAATQQLRPALAAAPGHPAIQRLLGILKLQTGDFAGALTAFQYILRLYPNDPISLYGQGLSLLGTGNPISAIKSFDLSEKYGGDPTRILLARRYAQWITGAQVSLEDAGLPQELAASQYALQGIQATKQGDWATAVRLLEASFKTSNGDTFRQAPAPLLSFDIVYPLAGGGGKLSAESLKTVTPKGTISGTILLRPKKDLDGVSYVSYEANRNALGVVNIHPFQYAWDTRRVPNGVHTVSVVLHNASAIEIDRIDLRYRVFNPEVENIEEDKQNPNLNAALWQAITLQPDRCAAAYSLGVALRMLGRAGEANIWFLRALAINPNYRDAKGHWIATGGRTGAGSAIWGGVPTDKVVCLTFDDGPKPGITEPLLEVLKSERVPATFFVIGRHVAANPALTRQIVDAGMELANHSYTHPNLTKISSEAVAKEILQTQAAIFTVTGKTSKYFRPPGGNWNASVAQVTRNWGLIPCMWTVDVYGSEVISAQEVAKDVLTRVRPGSIVLMHNGKLSTLQALPFIIRELRKRGYSFVTVETLARRLEQTKYRMPEPKNIRKIE